jgi:hypothetical protein
VRMPCFKGMLGNSMSTYNSVGMVPFKRFSPRSRVVTLLIVLLWQRADRLEGEKKLNAQLKGIAYSSTGIVPDRKLLPAKMVSSP